MKKYFLNAKSTVFSTMLMFLFTILFNPEISSAQTSGGPDEFGYTWRSSDHGAGPVYQWQNISAIGINLNLTDENCSNAVTIPGGFNFYGVTYNSVYIGDNGWFNFLNQQSSPYHPFIYSGTTPNALVAPFGEDLNGARGKVYYYNDAVNNRFIVQYDSLPRFYNNGYHTFQVILNKNDSTLTYQYKKSDNWHYTDGISGLPVSGIENSTGTTGINLNNAILKDNLAIKFYQPAPYIYYNPQNLNFTNTWVGKTDSTEVTLLNSGKRDLVITSIAFKNGTALSLSGLPANFPAQPIVINQVNSGDLEKFQVRFTPTDQYSITDTLIVLSNSADANSTLKIPISASSIKAVLSVLTPSLNFGNVQIEYKSTKDMNLILKNTGTAGLIVKDNSALMNNTLFKIVKLPSALPFTIPAGLQDTIVVRFAPTTTGLKTDTLRLYTNALNLPFTKIPLLGTGVASQILFNPATVAFDSTVQGVTATKVVRITNIGSFALTVSSISLLHNESYSLPGTPTSFTINPASFRDVTVSFTPVRTGSITDSIKISSNLPNNYYLPISGTGILPVLTIHPDLLDFGQVLLGSQKSDSVLIRNTGSGTLLISAISLTTVNSFSITSTFQYPLKIVAGGSKKVYLKFTPQLLGYIYNNLRIISNAGTYNAQLIGKGVYPAIEITKPSIAYGTVQVGLVKSDSLYIKNNGSADLVVSAINFDHGTHFKFATTPVLPLTVAPGSNYKLKLNFKPLIAAALTDRITISHNSGAGQSVNLSGSGSLPGIVYQPNMLSMDSTLENSVSSKYIWLKNSGNQLLSITSLKTKTDRFEIFTAAKNREERAVKAVNDLNFNLNAGDSLRLRVEFRPNSNVLFVDSLITTASVIGRSSLPLSGQGTNATYQLSAAQLNFGDQTVNSAAVQNVILTNNGNGKLYLQALTNLSPVFKLKNPPILPKLLYPGQSITLQTEFKPLNFGAFADTLNILTNSSQGLARVPLSGFGRGGALQLSKSTLNFGNISVGDFKKDSLYLRNYGNSPLTVSALPIGAASGIMSVETPSVLPFNINGGDSTKIKIRFNPLAVMNYQKQLTVTSNSVFANPNVVQLNGSGVSAAIYLSPNHLNFGFVHLDSTSIDSLIVYNNGSANLLITALSLTGSSAFTLVNPPTLPLTVLPGQNRKIKVKFSAIANGQANGVLNIINNAVNNVQVNLSGTGALGILAASTSGLNFQSVNAGSQLTKSLYLKNNGNYRLQLNSVSITSAAFTTTGVEAGSWLTAGDSVLVSVVFKPVGYQNYFDFLVVESDVGDLNIPLQGTGLQSAAQTNLQQLDFVSTIIGQTASLPLKIYNRGNKTLNVTALELSAQAIFGFSGITLPAAIAAQDSLVTQISFTPLQPQSYSDSLVVVNDSPNQPKVSLIGNGSGSNLVTGLSVINFNEVVLGSSGNRILTISNSGNRILTVDSLYSTLPAIFILNNGTPLNLPLTVPAGESIQLAVKFQPQNVTAYQAKIRFHSDSYDNSSDYVTVTGYGVSANIALNPGSLDYGIVKTGAVSLKYLKISNTGNSVLVIDSLRFRQINRFSLSSQPVFPLNIAPGTFYNIGVKFQTATVALFRDTLDIYNNSDNGVYGVLQGEGGDAQFSLSTNKLNFGDVTVASAKNLQLVLRNNGNYSGTLNSYSNSLNAYTVSLIGQKLNNEKSVEKNSRNQLMSLFNVPAGDSVLFNVRLLPSQMQSYLDTLRISAENFNGKTALTGKGVKALAVMTPPALAFGDVIINNLKSDTLDIANSGNTDLLISSLDLINKKGFTIRNYNDFTFPLAIQPGQKISLYLDFLPTELITYTEKIRIIGNNWQLPYTYVYLTGSGKSSTLAVTPTLLEYGSVELGNVVTKSVLVKNVGNIPLTISSITKKLAAYKLINLPVLPFNLSPGQQLVFNVQFIPNLAQLFNDTVRIQTSALKAEVVLTGTGSFPQFELSANKLDFDSVYVNNSKFKSLTIRNPGTSPLIINSITHKLPVYAYLTNNLKGVKALSKAVYTVSPGDSLSLLVTFTPTSSSYYLDTLVFNANSGIKRVALRGKGGKAAISINTNLLQFPATEVNSSSLDSVVVKNSSQLPLQINNLLISNNLIFRAENVVLPYNLPAGDSLVLKISFNPLQLTNYTASLQLINNSGYNPQITLKGSVLCGDLYLSALEDNFGAVSVGDLILDSVKVKNRGTAPIVVNDLQMKSGLHYQIAQAPTLPREVVPGDSLYISYRFKPLFYSANQLMDTLLINSSLQQAAFILRGRAVGVQLAFDPPELNFSDLAIPYSDTLTVKVKNIGEGRILVNSLQLQHANPFSLSYQPFNILNSGAEAAFKVIYRPLHLGNFTDSLQIDLNGPTRYLKITASCSDSVGIDQPPIPLSNEVYNNYPNPFNSTTILPYAVKEAALVSLKIYNVSGQLVKSAAIQHAKPGYYNFNLSLNGLSGGVYYYRLQINNDFNKSGRLLFLK